MNTSSKRNPQKPDRKLTPVEYMKVLEVEWWICNFRRKITITPADRRFYAKVSSLKKDRLIDISNRNNLPNIFENQELMKQLNKKFTCDHGGCPIFEGLTAEDVSNYYSTHSDVRCFYGFTPEKKEIVKLGKVKTLLAAENKVIVYFLNENDCEKLNFSQVSRIF